MAAPGAIAAEGGLEEDDGTHLLLWNFQDVGKAMAIHWQQALVHGTIITLCLYGFYFVTELRLVPSIKTLCERFHIPDDVAGATVMGAALNSPELFTSLLSTLATKNNVGLGTVMGSFNFNVLLLTGFTALIARRKLRSRQLKVEWLYLQRDVYFYAVCIGVIVLVCSDSVLEWYECVAMFALYVVYVLVCAFSGKLTALLCPNVRHKPRERKDALVEASEEGDFDITFCPKDATKAKVFSRSDLDIDGNIQLLQSDDIATPHAIESLKVQEVNREEGGLSMLKSITSSPALSQQSHQLSYSRSFTLPPEQTPLLESRNISTLERTLSHSIGGSFRDRKLTKKEIKMLVHLSKHPDTPEKVNIDLRLVTCAHDEHDRGEPWAKDAMEIAEEVELEEEMEEYHAEHLLAWPKHGSWASKVLYVVNFPFSLLVTLTIPAGERFYAVSTFISVVWLAGLSYVLSASSKRFGDALSIPDAVVGLTIDSVGTSLPNLIAAVQTGRRGSPDIAVCQAFGSNTFDALVAFGLVMLIKSMTMNFEPIPITATGVKREGLVDFLILFLYVWFFHFFRMRLTRVFGSICIAMYCIWLAYHLYLVYGHP